MRIGPFYIGFHNQSSGAPFADSCTTITRRKSDNVEIARYRGRCFLLTPWRRNKYNESLPQKALVLAIASKS